MGGSAGIGRPASFSTSSPESMTSPSRWLVAGLVAVGLILVLWPLADHLANVWPVQPGSVQWRYGAAGLLANFLHTPLLGLSLLLLVAWWTRSAGLMRGLGLASMVAAVLLLGVMAVFAMDLQQIRAIRPPEAGTLVLVGGAISELKYLTTVVAASLLGIGAWTTAGRLPSRRSATDRGGAGVVAREIPGRRTAGQSVSGDPTPADTRAAEAS